MISHHHLLVQEIKMMIEEARRSSPDPADWPEDASIACEECGIVLSVPLDEVDSLVDAMNAHDELCPALPELDPDEEWNEDDGNSAAWN